MNNNTPKADVCLFLEGTYPYSSGGVSTWTHELIQMQSHLTFNIVTLLREGADTAFAYKLPDNVLSVTPVFLQVLPEGKKSLAPHPTNQLFKTLEPALLNLQKDGSLSDLRKIIQALAPMRNDIGRHILFNSEEAWNMVLRIYQATMKENAFLDYFWSWRTLFGGMFSILLADLPEADCYHALCTGYAGLYLARAKIETGKPCIVTEHGIYTNERRIEISSADWLEDKKAFSLSVQQEDAQREMKDLWIDVFATYSRLCYEASSSIVTLFEGNQPFQLMDGAEKNKLKVIANGIDVERYAAVVKDTNHPPTIALIGRVVPIKDVKTFIKAVAILKESVPNLRALILGPMDEDQAYADECVSMVRHLKLDTTLEFTGKVSIADYLPQIDVIALTSLSEAQPLVLLEAGAAGIPTVSTNVGACHEMLMGASDESPKLGVGGAICPLSNPRAIAESAQKLLTDPEYYQQCCDVIKQRVAMYYHKNDQYTAYFDLYDEMLSPMVLKEAS